ncbi:GrpE-domain-containing protein [Cylindrobasidium torrendii FP15055 ss-10]|uniref:GrpE protein homolog, mitochondrial n=1 Tax=Cylindrobasidium torrendii FP15055 ss-10 TaxID=1314674 RepID=A0A0D7BL30_9AGAR|nr:GrpE-domain-containing protein [Cylindrobasidium torrendii FP15055 ss-10]
MSPAALRLVRSCTASLSPRTFARSSSALPSRTWQPRRHYSDAKPADQQAEDGKEDGASGSETAETLSPEAAKLKEKETEVTDLMGRLRYLQADFLNLQRNAARDKEQTRDFAITRFASDLLETVDVLSLALKSVPAQYAQPVEKSSSEPSSPPPTSDSKPPEAHLRELYQGVELTQRQLLQTLFKYHVKPFDPTGDSFDPNRHEALYQAPVPGKQPGTVIDCQKTGYLIKDRVLRAAQVGVAQESQS